ncbi:MAG TPA: IS66 family insertion sequence element accessory protein TnpB [Clostridia bacterium]|nr:IS66 family insertion sequence element accessory protein TnpB [Clostridia bacterium]
MTKKEKRMFSLVESWRESGKTRKQFCSEHYMKVSTFAYWVTRKNKAVPAAEGFLPVDLSAAGERKDQIEIHYPNGVRLSVPAGDVRLISTLIRLV